MDSRVWLETFVEDSWGCYVSSTHPGPIALHVDNLKCHVNTEREKRLATWCMELVPLPKSTSVLQPLDVEVMGPFKQKLRAITLAFELGAIGPSGLLPLRECLLAIERMSALEKRKRLVERVPLRGMQLVKTL
ncbi:DDE superfamily endonuclease [Phytophthora infestans]|uniref:DDE superfamily endonuclease n=1 Tax=Phytophthora infestans TaxID=4787 RepID=A0A833SW92_PHYIN|nr:DDE superfamily endonuclease [Phytophthora infestans]KAF4134383.1 DDE superfamily endonuclease [Phytophthora infestans]